MPTCVYCDREMSKYAIGKHQANCPEKPENQEKALRCLADPLNPGYALSERRYEAGNNSPCANMLKSHYGKWSDVAAAFGLQLMDVNGRRLADKLEATGGVLRKLSRQLSFVLQTMGKRQYPVCAGEGGDPEDERQERRGTPMIEPVAAFHIVKRPGSAHWTALPHRMLHGEPVSAGEAVRSVSGGHSCYVVEAGLAEVVARLTQGGINVVVEFADRGK